MDTLKGLPVANAINDKIIEEMKDWKGAIPHLAIVRVGERPDDMSYERGATKKMEKVGFRCTSYTFCARALRLQKSCQPCCFAELPTSRSAQRPLLSCRSSLLLCRSELRPTAQGCSLK